MKNTAWIQFPVGKTNICYAATLRCITHNQETVSRLNGRFHLNSPKAISLYALAGPLKSAVTHLDHVHQKPQR